MRKLYICFISFVTMMIMASCGGGDGKVSGKVSQRVKDHEAYTLGENHAAELIGIAADESAVQDKLLEVHARVTNIREKLGAQSAADYERGFTRYIEANSDSLARLLF
ncbi:hypothetical protein [uncultured Duncaniella sp.]|uniref:hypothetical protein n=1 Tax=uncultured Duncaniella sp. TaxID=2768039 RepID=UPI00261681F7|nr:hypothetical protein [uncultured Duncaniella sp.]